MVAKLAASGWWGVWEGCAILLVDASGKGPNTADIPIEMGIDVVITESEISPIALEYPREREIPVISSSEIEKLKPERRLEAVTVYF